MSKELEAFNFISEKLNGLEHYEQVEVNKHLDTILQALTPPTEEEVCEALSEYFGLDIMYSGGEFIPKIPEDYHLINITIQIPPHIVTLIGRFYERVGSNE